MRVVLSGYYGFDNVGDEAILLSIITALRRYRPDIEIVVLSNDPEKTAKAYGVQAVNRWKIKEVYQAIKQADGLISGGGSLLQDKTGPKSIPYYTGIMFMAKWLRKPYFIYAQGIGPITRQWNKPIVKAALSSAEWITVRDDDSKRLLQNIGVKRDIDVVPDPVIGFEPPSLSVSWLEEQGVHGPILSVSVRDWHTSQPYLQKVAQALDRFVQEKGVQIIFVPMHGKHDHETSKRVQQMMKTSSLIFPYDASIEEKIAIIGASDLLFGMRLHALIFAAITKTPFVALSYDPKIDAFCKQCHQLRFAHVDEEWSSEQLFACISSQFDNRDEKVQKLEQYVETLKEKAQFTAKRVIESLQQSS